MPTLNDVAAPKYADIFNYLNPNTEGAKDWLQQNAPTAGAGSYVQDANGNTVFVPTQTYSVDQSKIPDQYRGLVNSVTNSVGANPMVQYDLSRLPNQGKVAGGGDITQMLSLGSGAKPELYQHTEGGRKQDDLYAKDRSQVQFDPNYGWITSKMNMVHPPEDKNWMDYVGQAAQVAAGMALPGFGLASGLIQSAGNAADTGDWAGALKSAAPSLIGAAVGASGIADGIPSYISDALKYAKGAYGVYQGIHNDNPIGAAGSGLSLAQLASGGK